MVARTNPVRSFLAFVVILSVSVAVLALLAGATRDADAATIKVTVFDDLPVDGCSVNGCTLREAIIEANASVATDTIQLDSGTYTLGLWGLDNDADLGDLDINDDLTIMGEGATKTIIDANNVDRVFHVGPVSSDIVVNIADLTIRDGLAADTDGGGVYNNADLTLDNVIMKKNFADEGGAIFNNGDLEVLNSTITENHAAFGGGVHNNWVASIAGSTISNNQSTQAGAGIRNDTGILGVDLTDIIDNHAGTSGGGIDSRDRAIITRSRIAGNTADGNGGGVFTDDSMDLDDTTVDQNETLLRGGGVYNDGDLHVDRTTISKNTAGIEGGGIFNGDLRTIDFLNSTISGNTAADSGGGLYDNGGIVSLAYVTIAENVADNDGDGSGDGGGIATAGGDVEVLLLLLGNNIDRGLQAPDCLGTLESLGHNLIENMNGCALTGDPTSNILGVDPKIGPLGSNGGYTRTHALLIHSQAIDTESDDCPPPYIDQRGYSRPADGNQNGIFTCDIGAYEFMGEAPASATPTGTPAPSGSPTEAPSPTAEPTATPAATASPTPTATAEPEVTQGDLDCDGDVDTVDGLAALRYVAGLSPLLRHAPCPLVGAPYKGHLFGDVLCNGTVDSVDALAIQRFVAGLSPLAQNDPCTPIGS